MPQKVKETKHTVQDNGLQTIKRIMQIIFALIQFLLVFRFAFKLLGANASNVFVNLIYATTAPLVGLFEGIFPEMTLENNALAVFEPATVIAIIVTAAVSYIVLRMLSVKQEKVEHVEVQEQVQAVPMGHVSETQLNQVSDTQTPVPHASDRPVPHASERPVSNTTETTEAQREKARLEMESQALEEKIRRQQQILEDQEKISSNMDQVRHEDQVRHDDQVSREEQLSYEDQVRREDQLTHKDQLSYEDEVRREEPVSYEDDDNDKRRKKTSH